jgi:hypothetical protein
MEDYMAQASVTVHYGASDTPLEVTGDYLPHVRGVYSGPPENCYPDEGGYVEDYAIKIEGQEVTDLLDEAIKSDIVAIAWVAWRRGE